ncbi:MAG: DUF2066 domain-containing protein, partial [Alphaproteobacteria bacterium]
MIRKILQISLLLTVLFGTFPSRADVIPDLYVIDVPVESQGREERATAIRAALERVLVRVSGRQRVLALPAVEAALEKPTRFVQRYRYEQRETGPGQKQRVLQVRFDEASINQLLRDNQLPVWGRTRPAILVWLVVDDQRTRTLLSNDVNSDVRRVLEQQARQRGLPLRLPLYDLADRARLGITDVWGNFEDRILDASSRYQVEAVLVGRVYKAADNRWAGRWSLYSEGRRQDWESGGETLTDVMLPGIGQTAEALAQRFAQRSLVQIPGQVRIRIAGIDTLAAYTRAVRYLDSLDVVREVQPVILQSGTVVFSLDSRRGRQAVSQA